MLRRVSLTHAFPRRWHALGAPSQRTAVRGQQQLRTPAPRAAAHCRRSRRAAAVVVAAAADTAPLPSLGLQDAALRARESLREDKLFDDPWAAMVLGEAVHTILPPAADGAAAAAADAPSTEEVDAAAVSVRVLDAALLNAVAGPGEEAPRQVVLVGHGCDTRPFRCGRFNLTASTHLHLVPVASPTGHHCALCLRICARRYSFQRPFISPLSLGLQHRVAKVHPPL